MDAKLVFASRLDLLSVDGSAQQTEGSHTVLLANSSIRMSSRMPLTRACPRGAQLLRSPRFSPLIRSAQTVAVAPSAAFSTRSAHLSYRPALSHPTFAALSPYRSFTTSLFRPVSHLSSSSPSWLIAAAACISATCAYLYTTLASCDAATTTAASNGTKRLQSDTEQRSLTSSSTQPLSPIPQLTGSNELDWQMVRQLQTLLAQPDDSLTLDEQRYLLSHMSDPATCFRYLLARGSDLNRAAAAIKLTTRWRLANQVDALTAASLTDKLTDSAMWVSEGRARDGTPLIINRKSTAAETDHDRQFQLIVYTLERALRILHSTTPPPQPPTPANPHPLPLALAANQRWSWFLDMSAFSRGSSTPLSETRRIVDTLMGHYVERLNCVLILDAPSYFYWVWRAVSVVVPAKTKAKAVFFYDLSKEETRLKLQQYIDLNELEEPYGTKGKMTLDKYLATEPPVIAGVTDADRPS